MGRLTMHRVALRELSVLRVETVTPRLRRVVLGGEQLGRFERNGFDCDPFVTLSPEDHVKVFFPSSPGGPTILPEQGDGKLVWTGDDSVINRDYTVRRFEQKGLSGGPELTIDFVIHDAGVGSDWAAAVEVGGSVFVGGPKGSLAIDAPQHLVLWVDLTGVPAASRWCEEAPPNAKVSVIVEAVDETDRMEFVRSDGSSVDAKWFFVGADNQHRPVSDVSVADVATSIGPFGDDVFVFAAGETSRIKEIRALLKTAYRLTPAQFKTANYW